MLVHPINPIYDENSKILILGTFPSVKSREYGFYYGNPQNRFWRVIARICNSQIPVSIDDKVKLLLDNSIALWDVIHSCEITGSADSSIKNVVVNDIASIVKLSGIEHIYLNGKKAESLYNKYIASSVDVEATPLPSTSPANAMWSEDRLFEYWNEKISHT